MSALMQIAVAVREVGDEVVEWAAASDSPFSEEIYRPNVQIKAALELLAQRIEAIAQGSGL